MKAFLVLIFTVGVFCPSVTLANQSSGLQGADPVGTPFAEDSLFYKNDHKSVRYNIKAEYNGKSYSIVYLDNVPMASIMEALLVQQCGEDADVVYNIDMNNDSVEDFLEADDIKDCADEYLNGNELATSLSQIQFVDDTAAGYTPTPGSTDFPLSRLKEEIRRTEEFAGVDESDIQDKLDSLELPKWNQAGALEEMDLTLYRFIRIHQFDNVPVVEL